MIEQDLLTAVQYALLEPPTGGTSWLSELWTMEEVLTYLDLRQQRLLKATHMEVGIADIPGVITQSRYTLPEDWMATVLLAWIDTASGRVRELPRADGAQADLGNSTWESTSGIPLAYSDTETPPRTVALIPAPAAAGTLRLIYVPLASHPTIVGEPLAVPDEWGLPVVKYGVLADCLGKAGRGQDLPRARYCEWRTRLGEGVTKLLLSGGA